MSVRRSIGRSWRNALPSVVLAGGIATCAGAASGAQAPATTDAAGTSCGAKRPAVLFNRWQEDWSALAAPCVPRKPFDALKYLPIGGDPSTYLSLGANLRERFELNNAPLFGLGAAHDDHYVIERATVHADLRYREHLQAFVQFADARPFGKDTVGTVDRNLLDIEQAFVAYVGQFGTGTFKARVGRQEMAFDLQRFVSVRDGPNVRQAFDAVWADYEIGPWRLIGYATRPVQYRDDAVFDDVSNRHLRFDGVRIERNGTGPGDLSAYWSRYTRDNARYPGASGTERRDVFDMRYAGKAAGFDWDAEAMLQTGHVGQATIGAWAFGMLGGYTFAKTAGTPRIGIQIDGASGDTHPGDGRVGTFNPLFPNGYYFTLAGYTGYSNLVHVKPSLTFKPASSVTVLTALGFQWRATTADAIYGQGMAAVPGTAGRGDAWTGMYAQARVDWLVNANVALAVEAVHFQLGRSIRALGGRNADYVGMEAKFGW
ncbi:alginate export family protein [Burkholderia seminalis]|uniref:alginate export family protein n=1 Tax=Burkholderia seminalis TaxID=488731 RepID=UPI001906BA7D|nr:alginate export family protein [Burkholderia seminalis]MBJ9593007.1 alginate export family protein [Burkholderia seminalis]